MINRTAWKKGDRIVWCDHPKRRKFRRTGTIAGVAWSKRTGLEWAVESDPLGKPVVVKPTQDPFPLKAWAQVKEGDRLRLPPDPLAGDPNELVGTVSAPPELNEANGCWFIYLQLITGDITEVPLGPTPDGEVEWLNPT